MAVRPTSAQDCTNDTAVRHFQAFVPAPQAPSAIKSDEARELVVAALANRLPEGEALRCFTLAALKLLPESSRLYAEGPLTSTVDQVWEMADWVNDIRDLIVYDESGRQNEIISQAWSGTEWVNQNRAIGTYSGNQIVEIVIQEWNGSDWDNVFRNEFTFDGNGLQTQSITQEWTNGAWENVSQTFSTYDGNGNIATSETQFWDNDVWNNASRRTLTYDGQGREIESLLEIWSDDNSAYENGQRTVTAWSGDGLMSTATSQFWVDPAWFDLSRDMTTYDGVGRVIEVVDEMMDFLTQDWTPVARTELTYNASGNLASELVQNWSGVAWENEGLGTNTYDGDNDITESLTQLWNGSDWENVSRTLFNYGSATTNEGAPDAFAVSAIDLFPNPTRDRLTVDVTLDAPGYLRVDVYDLLGRHVATLADSAAPAGVRQLRWQADDQPAGLYLVRLQSGGQTRTHPFALIR
jgi:hypothetical protein